MLDDLAALRAGDLHMRLMWTQCSCPGTRPFLLSPGKVGGSVVVCSVRSRRQTRRSSSTPAAPADHWSLRAATLPRELAVVSYTPQPLPVVVHHVPPGAAQPADICATTSFMSHMAQPSKAGGNVANVYRCCLRASLLAPCALVRELWILSRTFTHVLISKPWGHVSLGCKLVQISALFPGTRALARTAPKFACTAARSAPRRPPFSPLAEAARSRGRRPPGWSR